MKGQDQEVKEFDLGQLGGCFPIIVVYKKPKDYPTKYIARLWDVDRRTNLIATAETLEELRESKPKEMMIMQRHQDDDPVIVETWI